MSRLSRFLFSLRARQLQRDVHDEVEFHIEMKTRELIEGGVPGAEARLRARRQFGNIAAIEDRTRDADRLAPLHALGRDLRFSCRSLRKSPTFTAVAIATMAIGIGANLAIFGMVEALLFRPLPFHDSKNVVMLNTRDAKGNTDWVSYVDLIEWRSQSATLDHLSAFNAQSVNITGEREPDRVIGAFVSGEFFDLLGAGTLRGRPLRPTDDDPANAPVVVASHQLWQTRFGGAEDFVGRKLILNGSPFTVVGVLPADFKFPWGDYDIWIPFIYYPNYRPGNRADLNTAALAHIRPGYSMPQAQAEMSTIARRLATTFPDTNQDRGATMQLFHEFVVHDVRAPLLLLWGAVAVVFLIACANLANLALSRILARDHELRVRAALGAGRLQLLSQVMLENLLLAATGLAFAIALGAGGLHLLARDRADLLFPGARLELDATTLAYGFILAIFGVLLCSSLAAAQVLRRKRSSAPEYSRGLTESRERGLARRVLVVAEISLSIVLLAGAGLLLKSYARLSAADPGFRTANLLTAEYRVPRNKYPTPESQWAFHSEVVRRLREIPGVRSASAILALPFSGNGSTAILVLPDRPAPQPGAEPRVLVNRAAPGFFETLHIPLERGRAIEERDRETAPRVAVVSHTFARRFWPQQDPIGRVVRIPDAQNTAFEIVGVVGDIRHWELDEPARPQMYVPFAQWPHIFSTAVIETAGDPGAFANALRQAVWSVDKDQPVWKVRTLESLTDRYLSLRAFLPRLLGGFAVFALLLAAIGIYGVIAYSTARRIREFGLRVAIGAQRRDVLWLVLRDGLRITVAGVVFGGAGALLLSRVLKEQLRGQLYRVESTDPVTFAFVIGMLAVVSLGASYLPARRALNIDPVIALRHD